jgi:hypothetical protein
MKSKSNAWNIRIFYVLAVSLLLCISNISVTYAAVQEYYVTQSGSGSRNGLSLANAWAMSDCNNASNWSGAESATQIDPGDTVYFNGNITSTLEVRGSGNASNQITLDFSSSASSKDIQGNGKDYYTLTNFTIDASSGIGESRVIDLGGNSSANQAQNVTISNGVITNADKMLIDLRYANNITIEGNSFTDFSGHGITTYSKYSHDIVIKNNTLTTRYYTNINKQCDVITFGDAFNVTIEGNYIANFTGGDPNTIAHNDCIQTYQSGSGDSQKPKDWVIRYNLIRLHKDTQNDGLWTMFEHLDGTWEIYSNVFLGSRGSASSIGLNLQSTSTTVSYVYSNTFISKAGGVGNMIALRFNGTHYFKNNVVYREGTTGTVIANPQGATIVRDYNIYYGGSASAYHNGVSATNCSSYAGQEAYSDCYDMQSDFLDYANNSFGVVQGSIAINTGVDLGSTYQNKLVNGATWPEPNLSVPTPPPRGAFAFTPTPGKRRLLILGMVQ